MNIFLIQNNNFFTMKLNQKLLFLIVFTLAAIFAVYMLPAFQQNISYHLFADKATFFGIKNFNNVISNLPFVIIGLYGLFLVRKADHLDKYISIIYTALFAGILLTGFGSAYYHSAPNNHHLVNDRVPMTMVFMALTTATIAERINLRLGYSLLLPLLIIGIASVYWWYYTETQHEGDLRVYAFVQFYPMLLIPIIILLFKPIKPDKGLVPMVWVITWYIIAKEFEHFDNEIYTFTNFVSGHTLKHLAAAIATWFIVRMFIRRYELNGSKA